MVKHSGNRFSFIHSLHIFHTLSKGQGTFWLRKLGHLYSHILKFPKDIGPDYFFVIESSGRENIFCLIEQKTPGLVSQIHLRLGHFQLCDSNQAV